MEKLKALKGAAQAIHHLLLSFDFLENKSLQLIQNLQMIRNLLQRNSPEDFISMLESEKVQPAEEVQLGIQRFQVALSKIITFFKAEVSKPKTNSSEKESEFDLKCLELVSSTVNLIITNCSGMEEIVNVLTVGENDDSNSSNWSLPMKASSNCKRRKNNSESSDSENSSVLKKHEDENVESSKKKPKPKPPTEEALENDVVLLEIFRHSSPANLKNFRLVNRTWNDTATSSLLIKNCLKIVLDGSEATTSNSISSSAPSSKVATENWPGLRDSLKNLLCLIEGSAKFPTRSLTFTHSSFKPDPQLRQLLRALGKEIKELTFARTTQVPIPFLRELLLDLAPNLESLSIDGCSFNVWNDQTENRLITDQNGEHPVGTGRISLLPNLKRLHFEPWSGRNTFFAGLRPTDPLHVEFFKELLIAAVNLDSVQTLTVDFLEVVLDSGRAQLISELTYEPFLKKRDVSERAVGIYEKLGSMKPKIKELCINLDPYNFRQFDDPDYYEKKDVAESTLNSILEFNKNRLNSLKIESWKDFSIDLPVLSTLKQLVIRSESRYFHDLGEVFSTNNRTFSFQNNFPHLRELDMCLQAVSGYCMNSYYPESFEKWSSPTVKHLTLRGKAWHSGRRKFDRFDFERAQKLQEMFPNVTSVVVGYEHTEYGLYCSPILWYLCPTGVKRLSIITGLPSDGFSLNDDEAMDMVDSFFTGIPAETCRRLRKWPQRVGAETAKILDLQRTQRSICDLKNLEELNLSFNDLKSVRPFASHVTGLYAFDLMPKLNVTFTYKPNLNRKTAISNKTPSEDMNTCLEHIAPYITQICNDKSYYYWWLYD